VLGLGFTADRQHIVDQPDVDIVLIEPGELGLDADLVVGLADVDPRRDDAGRKRYGFPLRKRRNSEDAEEIAEQALDLAERCERR